ncbi:MAG: DUF3169 family protein [Firmicutes bacterium]|nr:DUF3169 family protein [Bacillota bacterium]
MNRLMESQNSCMYTSDFYRNGALNQWMNNSDEGQRQIAYKAAFHVYRNTIRVLFFSVNLALILAGMRSAVGITAFLVIGVIWIFMSASFCVERNRMKKLKKLKNT